MTATDPAAAGPDPNTPTTQAPDPAAAEPTPGAPSSITFDPATGFGVDGTAADDFADEDDFTAFELDGNNLVGTETPEQVSARTAEAARRAQEQADQQAAAAVAAQQAAQQEPPPADPTYQPQHLAPPEPGQQPTIHDQQVRLADGSLITVGQLLERQDELTDLEQRRQSQDAAELFYQNELRVGRMFRENPAQAAAWGVAYAQERGFAVPGVEPPVADGYGEPYYDDQQQAPVGYDDDVRQQLADLHYRQELAERRQLWEQEGQALQRLDPNVNLPEVARHASESGLSLTDAYKVMDWERQRQAAAQQQPPPQDPPPAAAPAPVPVVPPPAGGSDAAAIEIARQAGGISGAQSSTRAPIAQAMPARTAPISDIMDFFDQQARIDARVDPALRR